MATRAKPTRARREHRNLRAENSHTHRSSEDAVGGIDGAGRTNAHDFGTVAGTPRPRVRRPRAPAPKRTTTSERRQKLWRNETLVWVPGTVID